ncbi:hypothetical protein RO3G_03861 [Lichtheimia corymbifera JMRC:FSU:9682]|uniref:LIM zinc-binding domain-containing protein n=1 Tax=Lichtheimia corymbifera JMRC:FSU:9682 TaxID=1263082 RepID=A0A068S8Z7_9FUNG|nr:hypothetical protein RO3G_03861 [Lichtheimia corymbifera JMRC:FSU:9682]
MMCCNRCGDILSSGKCRKCGGRAVASIIASGMGSVRAVSTTTSEENNQISIADKWQSQYENGILGSPHTVFDAKEKQQQQPSYLKNSTSSGTLRTRRNSSPQGLMGKRNSLSLSLQNSCAQCNQRLRYDTPSYLENGTRYCKNCHTDLFSKGNCSKCKKAVFPQRDTFIEHKTSVWHRDCFRCHGCCVALADVPMVDLRGRPCCEPCLMAQSGEARQSSTRQVYDIAKLHHPKNENNSSIASTPVLVKGSDTMSSAGSIFGTPKTPPNARPRIDSQLFHHYQKTLQRDNMASSPPPPPLSPAGSIRSSISGSPLSISPSSSPLSFHSSSSSTSRVNNASPVQVNGAGTQSPPTSALANATTTRRTTTMPPASPVPTSSESTTTTTSTSTTTTTTKNGRRMCAECNKPLQGTKVKMPSPSGDIWYHYDCLKCAGCRGHFTESKIVRLGNTIYHPECLPPSEPAEEQQHYKCHTCQKAIKDKCVRNGSKYYHIECFQCRKCQKVLDHSRPFYEVQNEPHCESCVNHTSPRPSNQGPPTPRPTPSHRMRGSTSTPLLPSHRTFDNNPSSLLMHRTRALPRLGGSKYCPRCHASIAIMDEIPGPNATRWHRKCLRCVGCKKQMDSGAKVSENENGESYVQCRGCRDKTGTTPKFVR